MRAREAAPKFGTHTQKEKNEREKGIRRCSLALCTASRLSHLPPNMARSSGMKTRLMRSEGLEEEADIPSWPFFLLVGSLGLGTTNSNDGVSSRWGSSLDILLTRDGREGPTRRA